MAEYRDKDGTLLLLPEQVAARANVDPGTIRKYNADATRLRRTRKWTIHDLPKPRKHVTRTIRKVNGLAGATRSPLYREDEIDVWLANRRGPGGRVTPPAEPGARTVDEVVQDAFRAATEPEAM